VVPAQLERTLQPRRAPAQLGATLEAQAVPAAVELTVRGNRDALNHVDPDDIARSSILPGSAPANIR
jgi:hypothetical protein